jgi:hypothetical protein
MRVWLAPFGIDAKQTSHTLADVHLLGAHKQGPSAAMHRQKRLRIFNM